MPENRNNETENNSFEKNLQEFAEIVSSLEKGDLPLEKAVSMYGDGVKLAAVCRRQLDEAKLRITGDKPDKQEG